MADCDIDEFARQWRWLVLALWATSLILPATADCCDDVAGFLPPYPGWNVLLLGWIAIPTGQIGWFGNVLLLIGFGICGRESPTGSALLTALSVGLIACLISAAVWQFDRIHGTAPFYLIGQGAGYYLWLGAVAGMGALLAVKAIGGRDAV